MASMELIVQISDKCHTITVPKDCSVDSLIDTIAKEVDLNNYTLRVLFGCKELERQRGKSVADYNIVNKSTLLVTVRLHGGATREARANRAADDVSDRRRKQIRTTTSARPATPKARPATPKARPATPKESSATDDGRQRRGEQNPPTTPVRPATPKESRATDDGRQRRGEQSPPASPVRPAIPEEPRATSATDDGRREANRTTTPVHLEIPEDSISCEEEHERCLEIQKEDHKDLPGYIKFVQAEDMISLVEMECAEMPCGHAISPSSMTMYCHSLLSEGRYTFCCPAPSCQREWQYFLVRHVASLSDTEKQSFEQKLVENYIKRGMGFQQCPCCCTWCSWNGKPRLRVACPYCKKHKPKGAKDFCWVCLQPWKGSGYEKCGNDWCDGKDPINKMLREAPMKKIYEVECPSLRACPKCHILIYHNAGCKHMMCTACKCRFCFVCLNVRAEDGFQCGIYSAPCAVAPVQTLE